MRDELLDMINSLPVHPPTVLGSGTFDVPAPNAFVCFNKDSNRVEIYPTEGGWLGAKATLMSADIAPFSD